MARRKVALKRAADGIAKATSRDEPMPSSPAIHAEERTSDLEEEETLGVRCSALVVKSKPQPTEEQELLGCLPWQHLRQLDVDLEKLLGEVPAGWRLLCTTDVTEHLDVKQRVEEMIQGRPSNSEISQARWEAILTTAIDKGLQVSDWHKSAKLQWAFVRCAGIEWIKSTLREDLSENTLQMIDRTDASIRARLTAALIGPHASRLFISLFFTQSPSRSSIDEAMIR